MRKKLSLFMAILMVFMAGKSFAQCGGGASIDVTESRCEATGTITANGATGSGNYLYDFVTYPTDYAYTGPTASNAFTALNPGSYTLRITDVNNACYTDYSVTVPGTYVQPTYVPTAVDVTNCYNGTNGEIHGTMIDGRAPFLYEIRTGSPCCVGTTNTTGDFTGLSAGTYNMRAYDSCGNFQSYQVTIGNFFFAVSNPVVTKTGCGLYSLDQLSLNPPTMAGYSYKVKDNTGATIATGTSLPLAFSHPDATVSAAQVCITDACGSDVCTPFTVSDWSITSAVTTYTVCNQFTTESITISGTPIGPLMYGFIRGSGDTVWSSTPPPFSFGPQITSEYFWGQEIVKDGCGVIKFQPDYYQDFMQFWSYTGGHTSASCTESSFYVQPAWRYIEPVTYTINGNPSATGTFTNLVDGTYTVVITDACGATKSEVQTLGHDWQLQGGSQKTCDVGFFQNYVSVNRRMKAPITYEQWDDTYSALVSTQTYTDPAGINAPHWGPTDVYAWVNFNNALPNTNYNYIVTDDCGRKDTLTVNNAALGHIPNTQDVVVTPLCINKGNITTTFTSDNPNWNVALLSLWKIQSPGSPITLDYNYGLPSGTYTWNNLDTGTYVVKYVLQSCSAEVVLDTVKINKYVQPRLRKSIAFSCGAGTVNVIGSVKGGLKPYQYEVFQTIPTGGEQPLQSSSLFTISGGPYSLVRLRVIDACGNSSIQDMAVRPPAKPTVKVTQALPQCNLSQLSIYVDSIYNGATYEWRNPAGTIISTGPELNIPVTIADTGTYTCRVYVAGSCYDDTTKFKLRTKDFGCYAKLGNYVWNDIDKDGVQDANEVGVAGVTVTLYDNNNVVVGATVTDAYGYYLFDNLNPGTYHVGFSLPSNYVFSGADQGGIDSTDSDPNVNTGITGNYTLAAGDSNMTVDAGIYQPTPVTSSLGDYVWNDLDKDGIQDPNELGVSGVTVTLYDNAGQPIATTVTDANGYYSFTDLTPGTYGVGFSLPIGYVFSPQDQGSDNTADSDVNPATGLTATVTLAAGENNPTLDAGIYAQAPTSASLGNYVWYDVNNNGIQDPNEGGVAGVTATLYAADGTTVLAVTTTDEFGYYIFNNLNAGDYVVGFSNYPAGYSLSPNDQGGNDATDSDVDPGTNKTPIINLSAGEKDMTWDAGIYNSTAPLGALGNYVWYDYDNDGVQDAGEPGVPGVVVNLYDGVGTFLGTTTTNASGNYIFNNLAAGDYVVEFTNLPPGYKLTTTDQGGDDATDSDPTGSYLTNVYTLGAGEVNLTVDAGIVLANGRNGTASLGDKVWLDANQDGIQDPGEQGVAGVTVTLYAADGVTVLGTKVTDALGNYLFTGLDAGSYVVGFSNIPAGNTFTSANQGTDPSLDANADATTGGKTSVINLATGEENLTIDAGIYPAPNLASLGNYVWNDLNQDGVQDANEPGVAGVSVTLYDPAGNALAVTTTDANGLYQFTGLTPGDYFVEFANIPAGFEFTSLDAGVDEAVDSDADPISGATELVNLVAGQNYPDLDAGIFTEKAGLGNYVWNDLNNDGIQDPNEEGIPGITVTLYAADGVTPVATTVTDANGAYTFVNLEPGTYVVGFSGLPAGADFSPANQGGNDGVDSDADPITGKTGPITLNAGDYDPTIDAGINVPLGAGLGNYVWYDANNDGLQGANESGVPGVTVILYNAAGTAIQSAITDQNGFYSFPNLIPGTYSVGFTNLPLNRGFTTSNSGADNLDSDVDPGSIVIDGVSGFPTFGSIPTVTIVAGEYNPTLDAGLILQFATGITSLVAEARLQGVNNAQVSWTTKNEKDVHHFDIQRSIDGQTFSSIAQKTAKGNTNGSTVYAIDNNIAELMDEAVIYYRIIAIDIDQTKSISNVVSVRPSQTADPVAVYPIPFTTDLTIVYPSTESGSVKVELTDVTGRTVAEHTFTTEIGQNTLTLDKLETLSVGSYFIKVISDSSAEVFVKKIQKK